VQHLEQKVKDRKAALKKTLHNVQNALRGSMTAQDYKKNLSNG